LVLILFIAGAAVIGLVITGSGLRRLSGLAIAVCLLSIPFLMIDAGLIVKSAAILMALIATMRSMDLAKEQPSRSAIHRVWHMLALFDTRRAVRRRPTFKSQRALEAAGWLLIFLVVIQLPKINDAHVALWLYMAMAALALPEIFVRIVEVGWTLLGIQPPPMHDAPYLSRTLREFWGIRWNKIVGGWLKEHCYTPLAIQGRRRRGIAAAFAMSGLIHCYLVVAAIDWRWCAPMAAFFLLQIPLIWVEDRLRIRHRPAVIGHIWTISTLLIASPLLTEPFLDAFQTMPLFS